MSLCTIEMTIFYLSAPYFILYSHYYPSLSLLLPFYTWTSYTTHPFLGHPLCSISPSISVSIEAKRLIYRPEMAVSFESGVWDCVIEITKVAQQKGSDPLLWALQISSNLSSYGVILPSPEFADVLVSYICWDNNVSILWKFLEKALVFKIVPPLMVLALLSERFFFFFGVFPLLP